MITERITKKISIVICEGGKYSSDIEKTVSAIRKSFVLDLIELADEVRKIEKFLLMTNHIDLSETNN